MSERWLSITEVAKATGLKVSTIRYYDQQFEGLLGVKRAEGRKRLFPPEAVEKIKQIRHMLKDQGMSIRQVREVLGGGSLPGPVHEELAKLKAEVDELKEVLRRVLDLVERVLAVAARR